MAFVVPTPGTQITPQEVKRHALDHGPAYAHPRLVEILAQLPVSGTHKIDRKVLSVEANRLAVAAGRVSGG